jgi:Xaa-Pro aminopeptidase
MSELNIKGRIEKLRQWMEKHDIQAYIMPTSDPHKSEYLADHWQVREWISGFTGSAGTLVVTLHHAGLWTDSRYFIQAEQELQGTGIVLHKLINQGVAEYLDWMSVELIKGDTVAVDGWLWSIQEVRHMERVCTSNGFVFQVDKDPFSEIWEDRPSRPNSELFSVEADVCGESRMDRIGAIREVLFSKGADAMLVTALDEIAWLLLLRGRDVACNPVFVSYLLLERDQVKLFLDPGKLTSVLASELERDGIEVLPYSLILEYLGQINPDITLLVDPNKTAFQLHEALGTGKVLMGDSPIMLAKARKNAIEQENLRRVMIKDGIALVKAFRWLEERVDTGVVSEADLADKIAHFRSLQAGYFGESFNAIVGYKGNGAIVHYRPEHGRAAVIGREGVLLVDSGGQYMDGTTDITRTVHLGIPKSEEKKHFTLVLKGHIALAMAVFPMGTRGVQLDLLARQYLWSEGLNFGHGTGHGVGFFMNVHEPPQGFVANLGERGVTAHEPGMYSSNEPGFYKAGEYGIRIENLVLCQSFTETLYGQFLHFETITLFPIDKGLIDRSLLAVEELEWLNNYHKRVYEALAPHMDLEEISWLQEKCAAL